MYSLKPNYDCPLYTFGINGISHLIVFVINSMITILMEKQVIDGLKEHSGNLNCIFVPK